MTLVAAIAVGVALWLGWQVVRVRRGLGSVTAQLRRRQQQGTHHQVTLQLGNRPLDEMVGQVNAVIDEAERAAARARGDEQRFRALIADISHDLRTPLTAITGYEQLLDRTALDADQRAKLAVVRAHTAELQHLVDRFFEYSYLLESEPRLEPGQLDLVQVLADCLLGHVGELEAAGIDATLDAPECLPWTTHRQEFTPHRAQPGPQRPPARHRHARRPGAGGGRRGVVVVQQYAGPG